MSGNKMALDALMAAPTSTIERTQHCTLEDRLAASDKARLCCNSRSRAKRSSALKSVQAANALATRI